MEVIMSLKTFLHKIALFSLIAGTLVTTPTLQANRMQAAQNAAKLTAYALGGPAVALAHCTALNEPGFELLQLISLAGMVTGAIIGYIPFIPFLIAYEKLNKTKPE